MAKPQKREIDFDWLVDNLMPEGWEKSASKDSVVRVAERLGRLGVVKAEIEQILGDVVDAVIAESSAHSGSNRWRG